MKLTNTLSKIKKTFLLLIFCLTTIIMHGQVVSTVIDDFPGDGEMVIDYEGFLYVNDSGMGPTLNGTTVLKVDPIQGTYEVFRDDLDPFVVGIIFDANWDLLVTGWSSGTITKIFADGTKTPFAANINGAGSLEVDENGNVYVAEFIDDRVVRFDSNGGNRIDFSVGFPIERPAGLAYVAATGKLYVSNWENGKIIEIDTNGNATEFAELFTPNAGPIKIDPSARYMYATSPMHHVIYRIEMDHPENVEVFAGIIDVDGTLDEATFDTPTGLAIDGTKLYIAENFNDNGRLRVIEGILEIEDNNSTNLELTVFPNPAKDVLKVQYDLSKGEVTEWNVFDLEGRKISLPPIKINSHGVELNIEHLLPGMYFLNAVSSSASHLRAVSFIKE